MTGAVLMYVREYGDSATRVALHTHMLHEDMTSDYRKIGQDMIYVIFFSLTEWSIFVFYKQTETVSIF